MSSSHTTRAALRALTLAAATLAGAGSASAQLGTLYCNANPNTTGAIAMISATGSTDVALNNVTLACASLPFHSFGYFLVSRTQGFVANPAGSSGNLCLGGSIGRYSLSVLNAGSTGQVSLPIDLVSIPHPTAPFTVMGGDTLNFQYWHRDGVAGQPPTSNLSRGLEVTFTSGPSSPSFLNDVYPLLSTPNTLGWSCVDCHGGTCSLDLSSAPVAYTGLVNVAGSCCPNETLVVPGNSAGSLLYLKLTAPPCGSTMPLIGTFNGDPNVIRDWIDAGALNN